MPLYGVTERHSYLRAYREVGSTPEVERFLARIEGIGEIALGFKDATFVKLNGANVDDEMSAADLANEEGKGIGAVTVYPANRLWVPLFEQVAIPTPKINHLFSRVLARVTGQELDEGEDISISMAEIPEEEQTPLYDLLKRDAEELKIEDDSLLTVHASRIGICTKPQFANRGEQIGLVIDPSPITSLISKNRRTIHTYVAKTGPGSELNVDFEEPEEEIIAFSRLPANATHKQLDDFMFRAQSQIPPDGLTVELGPVDWMAQNRPPKRRH